MPNAFSTIPNNNKMGFVDIIAHSSISLFNGVFMPNKPKKELTHSEAMRIFHQDGIIEVITGAMLINFGFDILNRNRPASLTTLFTYIPIFLLSSMKAQVTISRIGYEAFGSDEKKVRNMNFAIAAGLLVTLLLLSITILSIPVSIFSGLSLPFGGDVGNLFAGVILALACLAGGYFIPLKRLYLYAPVAFFAGLISFFLPFNPPFNPAVPVFFFAIVILVPGIQLMIRFTRAYPLPVVKK
jgi:hypothetical protein